MAAGVSPPGEIANSFSLVTISGECTASAIADDNLAATVDGVPGGATTAYQNPDEKPGKASAMAGTCGQFHQALFAANTECRHGAGCDLRHCAGKVVKHEVDLSRHDRVEGRRQALERNMQQADAGLLREQFHRQLRRAAVSGGRIGQLARIGLGVSDKLFQA